MFLKGREATASSFPLSFVNGGDGSDGRIVWFDVARGISVILVVLFHASIAANQAGIMPRYVWLINDLVAPIRMPLFFAISGILGNTTINKSWKELLSKRIILLWYLYVLWSTIGYFSSITDFEKFRLAQWYGLIIRPNTVLWFIWALGIFFAVAKFSPKPARGAVLLLSITIAVFTSTNMLKVEYSPYLKSIRYMPFFLFGIWFNRCIIKMLEHYWITLIVSGLSFNILFFTMRWSGELKVLDILLSSSGMLLGLSGSIVLERVRVLSRIFRIFGRNTLTIYLSHSLFLVFLVSMVAKTGLASTVAGQSCGLFLVSGGAIALAFVLRRVSEGVGAYWLYALPRFVVAHLSKNIMISESAN